MSVAEAGRPRVEKALTAMPGTEVVRTPLHTSVSEPGAGGTREGLRAPGSRPGGDHYRAAVEPVDLIDAFDLGFHEGQVIKYVTRWRRKNGLEDLDKAAWYLDRLRERARREVDVA